MRTIEITLSGKTHTICELPSRKAAAWRALLQEKLGAVANLVESAPNTETGSAAAMAGLVRSIGATVIGSTDTVIELLFAYAPQLALAGDGEADVYDSELVAAFLEVIKLAYPFGQLASLVASFGRGAATK